MKKSEKKLEYDIDRNMCFERDRKRWLGISGIEEGSMEQKPTPTLKTTERFHQFSSRIVWWYCLGREIDLFYHFPLTLAIIL